MLTGMDVSIDHTTLSSNELRRAKEAFNLYVDSAFSPLSFVETQDVLETHFRGKWGLQRRLRVLGSIPKHGWSLIMVFKKCYTMVKENFKMTLK